LESEKFEFSFQQTTICSSGIGSLVFWDIWVSKMHRVNSHYFTVLEYLTKRHVFFYHILFSLCW